MYWPSHFKNGVLGNHLPARNSFDGRFYNIYCLPAAIRKRN